MRLIVHQELDPFGGDAGLSPETQIPDEGALAPYGSSYSSNSNVTYTVDGIRVTLDFFILRLGHLANDPMALLEMSRDPAPALAARPAGPPQLVPFNHPLRPHRPFDTDIEQRIGGPSINNLNALLTLLPQKIRKVDFETELWKRITIEHFDKGDEAQIRREMKGLFTRKCAEAFQAAYLSDPTALAFEQGIVIRPSNDLFTHSAEQLGLVSDATRRAYAKEFSSVRAQEGTIPAGRNGVQLTTDGRPQIYLHTRAFWGESYLDSRFSLKDVLSHAFIHAGGQGPAPNTFDKTFGTGIRHDLSGYTAHDPILAACR